MKLTPLIEKWKDIKGFDGVYQVSSSGLVKSLWYKKERILKPGHTRGGYLQVVLCKGGCKFSYYIARLVANHFIVNPMNKKEVNHKDGNKRNNTVSNLEWCTPSKLNSCVCNEP